MNVGGDTPGACPEPLAKQIEMLEGGEGGGGTEAGKALADELCCLRTLSKMSHSDALLSDPAAAAASRLEAAIRKLEGEQQRGAAGVAAAEAEAEASDEVDETAGRARVMRLLRKEVDRLKSRERTQQDVSRCGVPRSAPTLFCPALPTWRVLTIVCRSLFSLCSSLQRALHPPAQPRIHAHGPRQILRRLPRKRAQG